MPEIISYEDKGKQSKVFDAEKSAQSGNMEASGSSSDGAEAVLLSRKRQKGNLRQHRGMPEPSAEKIAQSS